MKRLMLIFALMITVSLCGCETGRGLKKDFRQLGKDVGKSLSETGKAIKKSVK